MIMSDVDARIGLLLSLATAACLIAQEHTATHILSWLTLAVTFWSVFITAPCLRLDVHWRSLAIYLLNLVLAALSVVDAASDTKIFLFSFCVGYGITMVVVALLTAVVYYYLPVPSPCKLTGQFKEVGTYSFVVSGEPGSASGDITVQCWFPLGAKQSEIVLKRKALIWTSGHPQYQAKESMDLLDALAATNKWMPSFGVKHLATMRTNSLWQESFTHIAPPAAGGKYPIAVYSHGMWGWRQIHHSACENLASHGFVVLACDHTPDSMCSRPFKGKATRFDFHTPAGLEPAEERKFFQGGMERRVAQLTLLVTHLESEAFASKHPSLRDRLDFDNLHMWGHSYGGGTIASLCCRKDSPVRVKSAVMLDGWMYPVPDQDRRSGFQSTAMLKLSAERWPYGKYQFPFREDLVKHTTPSTEVPAPLNLVLRGSDHQNFVDVYLIAHKSLLSWPSMLGKELDSHQVMSALDELLPAYFLGVAAHAAQANGNVIDDCREETSSASVAAALAEEVDVALEASVSPRPAASSGEGEVTHKEAATATDSITSETVHPSVQALLEVCGPRLSPRAADFFCSYVMHASDLPSERVDTLAFDRVVGNATIAQEAEQKDEQRVEPEESVGDSAPATK